LGLGFRVYLYIIEEETILKKSAVCDNAVASNET
jgi:hypothetical protein